MAEDKKETAAAPKPSVAGAALDTVNGLFEGIGQFIRERSIFDIVVAWGLGAITTKVVVSSIKDFLDHDPLADEIRSENHRRMRAELMLDAEMFCDKVKEVFEATFGKAYHHLKKAKLMNDREFREFIAQLEAQSAGYKLRRCQSLSRRKLIVRIGVSLMVFIILCGAIPPDQRGWIFGLGLALAVIGFLVAVAIQNNNRRPAFPIDCLQPQQQPIGE